MKRLFFIAFAASVLVSCQSSSDGNSVESAGSSTENFEADPNMPAINPAHGQPYHDCSIPVGDPLVAKKPAGENTGKLNPEHGQPGHRCDLPVGAPLG